MNCLYCGKKLPMVKKLTSEDFCSVAHRHAYQSEQEALGVARLVEAHERLRPVLKFPPPKVSDLQTAPHVSGYLADNIAPRSIKAQLLALAQTPVFAPETLKPAPDSTIFVPRSGLAAAATSFDLINPQGNASVEAALRALPQGSEFYPPSDPGPQLVAVGFSPAVPDVSIGLSASLAISILPEAPVDPDTAPSPLPSQFSAQLPLSLLKPQFSLPLEELDFTLVASAQLPFDLSVSLNAAAPKSPTPIASSGAKRFSFSRLPGLIKAVLAPDLLSVASPVPLSGSIESWQSISLWDQCRLPLPLAQAPGSLPAGVGSCFPLNPPAATGPIEIQSGPVAQSPAPPQILPAAYLGFEPFVQPAAMIGSQINAAPQARQIACFAGPIQRIFARPKPLTPRAPGLMAAAEFPAHPARACVPAQSLSARSILARPKGKYNPFNEQFFHPDSFLRSVSGEADMAARMAFHSAPIAAKTRIASVRRSSLVVLAKTFRSSRLVPITIPAEPYFVAPRMVEPVAIGKFPLCRPQLNLRILPARVSNSPFAALSPFSGVSYKFSWQAVQYRWSEAPNDLRWIAMAVPLVIGLIWFANSPSAQSGAKGRIASFVPNVGGLLNTSFKTDSMDGIKQNIQRRAAVELSDDFRQGLGEWSGVGDWSRGWTYDPAGFIRPRQLALYTPSLSLEDYRFEFLGAIEKKSLSWVFRAADVMNYYAARLEVTRGGPLPIVELVRYAVINGKADPRKSIPLPMQGRLDTIYRVRVDVLGNDFVTTVQGQVVDVFSDDRLPRGGVGFFSNTGEDARLRWIEVSHQYDMLGRLCAYLVPYNVPNSNVRSAP